MTPLALRIARELTIPVKDRAFKGDDILSMFTQDMHCFDVTAIHKSVDDAMSADNLWEDIVSMVPGLFLPSPVTWLEIGGDNRAAYVVEQAGDGFRVHFVQGRAHETPFTLPLCTFRARSVLEPGERIEITPILRIAEREPLPEAAIGRIPYKLDVERLRGLTGEAKAAELRELEFRRAVAVTRIKELDRELVVTGAEKMFVENEGRMIRHGIGAAVLMLDLINTPGLIGLKQYGPHRGLAKQLSRVGSYPLRGWTEIVLKATTAQARGEPSLTGPAFHKCLHFVRSHQRHYQSGHVTIIPAHWRGDPALGIKRTRYRLEAPMTPSPKIARLTQGAV